VKVHSYLEEASTHNSAINPRRHRFVTRELDLLAFWSQRKRVSCTYRGTFVCVRFGDPSYIGFWDMVQN